MLEESIPIAVRWLMALDPAWNAKRLYLLLDSSDQVFQLSVDIFENLWFSSLQWKHTEKLLFTTVEICIYESLFNCPIVLSNLVLSCSTYFMFPG